MTARVFVLALCSLLIAGLLVAPCSLRVGKVVRERRRLDSRVHGVERALPRRNKVKKEEELISKIGFGKGTASAVPLKPAKNAGFSP